MLDLGGRNMFYFYITKLLESYFSERSEDNVNSDLKFEKYLQGSHFGIVMVSGA